MSRYRYGRSRRGGVPVLPLILVVLIGGVVLAGVGGAFNGLGVATNSTAGDLTINLGNAQPGPIIANGGRGLDNQPPAVRTQTAVDVNNLQNAFGSHIRTWGSQLANNVEIHTSANAVGLANGYIVSDIVYGKCGADFFIFVIYKGSLPQTDTSGANLGGYMYTTASTPLTCHSSQYKVVDFENDGGGWYFTYFRS